MKRSVALTFSLLAAATPLPAVDLGHVPVEKWQTAGDARVVQRDGGGVTLAAKEAATAGAVSPPTSAPPGTTALLISADLARADALSVTFSAHAVGGETVGYWQNPLPIPRGPVAAVLPTTRPTGPLRVFVGTHAHPSAAAIQNIRLEAVRVGMSFRGTTYGTVVHGTNTEGQSFKARGKRLAAVRVLVRRMKAADGPDLRVRLYPLGRDGAPATGQPPLAEAVVPREQIPESDQRREEVAVALPARTTPGGQYVVEFSTSAPCDSGHGFLVWGGSSTYADGSRYQNGTAVKDWDLHVETYDGM